MGAAGCTSEVRGTLDNGFETSVDQSSSLTWKFCLLMLVDFANELNSWLITAMVQPFHATIARLGGRF